jgi:hypothetical protein
MSASTHADARVALDGELALASTPTSGMRRQQAQASESFRGARSVALLVKRQMAAPLRAIDERAAFSRPRPRPATCPPCPPQGGQEAPGRKMQAVQRKRMKGFEPSTFAMATREMRPEACK